MNKGIITSLLALALTAAATSAQAVPAFARKYDADCGKCHNAFPQLNTAGRKFKEAGYRFPKLKGEETISDFLQFDEYFPASAIFVSRPYDKKDNGDDKVRAIHELELMVAGRFYKNVSGFFEMEAEDEDTNSRGFEVGIPAAWLTYTYSDAIKAQATWGELLATDPYDTYAGGRRLTRGTQAVIDKSFGGADDGGKLGDSRQSLSIFGRPIKQLFYSVGYGGNADDSEGVNPNTLYGRLAWDVMPNIMIGALYVDGECEDCMVDPADPEEDRDYTRYGVDAQADIGDARVMGVWLTAEDDDPTGNDDEENDAWYLQGEYVFKQDGRPTIVPLVRVDSWQEDDGNDDFKTVTLNLGYYFTQNIKGYIEYWNEFDTPSDHNDDSRLTVQIVAGF
ncbi:MAG: hypothetical protein ABFS22_11565 [Pseudomonadota bacterium]